MTKFIGDVHGYFSRYEKIIREYPDTIQVGDMGVGFRKWPHGEWQANPPHDKMVASRSRFIRGNHDNPLICKRHSQWIADGHVEKLDGLTGMFIGGGLSIDKDYRIEDFSWWPEEQLSQIEMNRIADIYEKVRPEIMVTHECPITASDAIPHSHHYYDHSRTAQFLQSLWNFHKPKIWVHGHHHISVDHVIEGTRFVCLAEMEMRDI
jgi:Icc-related predicted phosphoesterase